MQSFTYTNPTRVHFGRGVISKLSDELTALNASTVLLVYGQGSIFRNGVYNAVMAEMAAAGVAVVHHEGVRGNPVLSHTRAGVQKARDANVDVICAVGGGSVIDEAKAISAGAVATVDVWDFFCGKEVPAQTLPLLAVSTLPATGSEMNGICVVTNEETHQKNALVKPGLLNPRVSFLDPETTMSLGATRTAFACTDILSHVMEAYFTTSAKRLALQDNLMEGICRATVEAMDILLEQPNDYDARAAFMWASNMAWSGIAQAGVPETTMPCHALEMPLSAIYDIAHGAGLSIVIPAWIKVAGEKHLQRISAFVDAVFKVNATTPDALSVVFSDFYRHIGSPVSLTEAGILAPDLDRLTELSLASFVQRGMTDYTSLRIKTIFEECVK